MTEFEIISNVLANSTKLPAGNENYFMLEYISGMSRNQSLVILMQTLNQIANSIALDQLSIQPGFDTHAELSENLKATELVFGKKILLDNLWITMRHQFNQENSNIFALTFRLKPWLSIEGHYNKEEMGINLFYNG